MKYRIAFIDIDWTILDHDIHDWDYESLDVLRELQRAGLLIYLCTARPYDSIVHTGLLNIFHPDGIICTNGGVTFVGDKLLFANTIPEEIVRDIERISNKHGLVLELSTNKERYFTRKANGYVHRYFSVYSETIPEIRRYEDKEVSAILLFAPVKYDEILKKEFPKEMNLFRFDDYGVDVGFYKNTKGGAIKKVLEHLNINKSESIGAGDSFDDISMFKEVGVSICMGNGTDEAKVEADIVSEPISKHGLGKILKELIYK